MNSPLSQNNPVQLQTINWKKGLTGNTIKSAKLETMNTKPPEYYNEGTLISAMKNVDKTIDDPELKKMLKGADGLGTPATRGSIIDNLTQRGWVETINGGMHITEKGKALLNQVPESSGFRNAAVSAYWEMGLKKIELSGDDSDFESFYSEMVKSTQQLVNLFAKQGSFKLPGSAEKHAEDGKPCKKCEKGEMKSLASKGKTFLKCQNPDCGQAVFPPEIWGNSNASSGAKKDYSAKKDSSYANKTKKPFFKK